MLSDPLFRRSPTQSKLLRYLVQASVRGGSSPSQFEIAVDALGKNDDFDTSNDSYPRVQMSRLRTNLDNVYARIPPGEAGRLVLRPGRYLITLETDAELPPAIVSPVPPANLSAGLEGRPLAGCSRLTAALVGAAIIVLAAASFLVWKRPDPPAHTNATPQLVIQPVISALETDDVAGSKLAQGALQAAEMQLAHSLFTRTPPIGTPAPDPDYRVRIAFSRRTASNTFAATIVLTHRDGEQLFSGLVEHDAGNPQALIGGIEAAMIQLVSPQGAIARREVARIADRPGSAFECFILIENEQADGRAAPSLIDHCLVAYPDSEFTPYWHARRAYETYQADLLAGRPLAKAGQPWEDLLRSLDRAPFNPFANFVLAKLELANGDCAAAAPFMERTFLAGSAYPALVTALDAEAEPCLAPAQRANERAAIRALFDRHPHPNPMFRTYLILSSLAYRSPEEARRIASRTLMRPSEGPEARISVLLQRAAGDPAFARANSPLLITALRPFIWNPRSAQTIIAALQQPDRSLARQESD